MAKHNEVYLYGQVIQTPYIYKEKTGEYIKGIFAINVLRNTRYFGNNEDIVKYDCPVIMSANEEYIKKMEELKTGDMVIIKGMFTTKEIIKSIHCECGCKNSNNGIISFINPIYIKCTEKNLSKEEGLKLLKESKEISNCITIVGDVCKEPQKYISDKGTTVVQYPLKVRRKYRVKEDPSDIKMDFPMIKTFNKIALDNYANIKKGSRVLIDGMVQMRDKVQRITICSSCGKECHWTESVMEIIPYAVEYLSEYTNEEELKNLTLSETEIAKKQIFG